MQAITTKYFGPTNTRGSKIKATAAAGSVTISYNCALSQDANHKAAALALCAKMEWEGNLISGDLPGGQSVFVFEPKTVTLMRDALGNLCQFVAGNRGNRDGNPYCKEEMCDALLALYLDQHDGQYPSDASEYINAADKYRKEI